MEFELNAANTQKIGRKLKCILIGDEGIGKSAIVKSFRDQEFSVEYAPTIWNNYSVSKSGVGGEKISLDICDTGGQTDFDRFRPLCYTDVNVFLICFSVASPRSFQNILTKWMPEIKRHSALMADSERVILLVGTKSDLRSNTNVLLKLSEEGISPVSEAQALKLAKKIGAKTYIECSSLVRTNVKQVFEYTLIWGLNNRITSENETPVSPQPRQQYTVEPSFKLRGPSGHFFRWKSTNQKHRKHRSMSNEIKRFILMCCLF